MKTNKAPEKVYLSKNIFSTYLYQVPDHDDETAVEYIRADAFIEKACDFISSLRRLDDDVIEDFKNYIKGE